LRKLALVGEVQFLYNTVPERSLKVLEFCRTAPNSRLRVHNNGFLKILPRGKKLISLPFVGLTLSKLDPNNCGWWMDNYRNKTPDLKNKTQMVGA
jgi:hypothetical protein